MNSHVLDKSLAGDHYLTETRPRHVVPEITCSVRHKGQPAQGQADDMYRMKRIVIIGSSGSGKSTLARQLGSRLGLPVHHLDKHYWKPGWEPTPEADWEQIICDLVSAPQWILDGNYRSTLPERLAEADTVIFLDLPRWLCVARAIKRRFQYMRRPRPDISEGCTEPIVHESFPRFLHWIWHYRERARPDIIEQLSELSPDQQLIWLKSPAAVDAFLAAPEEAPSFEFFFRRLLKPVA